MSSLKFAELSLKKKTFFAICAIFIFIIAFYVGTMLSCVLFDYDDGGDADSINNHYFDVVTANKAPVELFGPHLLPKDMDNELNRYRAKKTYHVMVYNITEKDLDKKYMSKFKDDAALIEDTAAEKILHIFTNDTNNTFSFLVS